MNKPILFISITGDEFIDAYIVSETEDEHILAKDLYIRVKKKLPKWEKELKKTNKTKVIKEKV